MPGLFKTSLYMVLLTVLSFGVSAQEALKSLEEEYYSFLALRGLAERPALDYRTLSDSVWRIRTDTRTGFEATHPWQPLNLGTRWEISSILTMRIYGPELYMSVNTAAPYGQNDGALWQGKGFNTSLTGGLRLELGNDVYGRLEGTFKPQVSFSQNAGFDYMRAENMIGSNYAGKADTYGYYWGVVDAPQRFGDSSFWTYDWGDTEIRYSWKTLTFGFGTQAIWLGPSYRNSMLHANNAPAYPKFDIGLRRQRVTLPWLGWYIGDIEARLWIGWVEESDYFDNDDSNNRNMFHGLTFAYAPSFIPGFTLFANRVCLAPWDWASLKYILPSTDNTNEDQKASFGFSWAFPSIGFELYGELGIDDFVPDGLLGILRNPFHTTVYAAGFKKAVQFSAQKQIYGELVFEFNWMEMTQDYQFMGTWTFYTHGRIKQGYTNRGQWIGSSPGMGGNSQYLGFNVYYPRGKSGIFIERNNPDNTYLYKKAVYDTASNHWLKDENLDHNKANFDFGLSSAYYITPSLVISGTFVYNLILNPLYQRTEPYTAGLSHAGSNELKHNFSLQFFCKYVL